MAQMTLEELNREIELTEKEARLTRDTQARKEKIEYLIGLHRRKDRRLGRAA